MSSKNDGGHAFPRPVGVSPGGSQYYSEYEGMTLRDWFAGQALGAMIAQLGAHLPDQATEEHFAELAYGAADAMLAERRK